MNKKIIILGGGTFSHVRSHLAIAAPAFGMTARHLQELCQKRFDNMNIELALTKMADPVSKLVTNQDVAYYIEKAVASNLTKVIFFSAAMCDFNGEADQEEWDEKGKVHIAFEPSHKYAKRLTSSRGALIHLTPAEKIISSIRKNRKDIFLVGFKTTCGESKEVQFKKGLNLLKTASCNLVVVNDIKTRETFIVTPEEAVYGEGMTRDEVLKELVDMVYHRTHLSFTRSTVISGLPVKWEAVRDIYPTLTEVVEYCIEQGAYKPFNGATVGHFAAKLGANEFLTSIRKTNFNDIAKNGMVRVITDGEDDVISYGAKPSVGGQSQRYIFEKFPDLDCIVHFHCPLKLDHKDTIPVVSQREYECGSHECGQNTAKGLGQFGNIYCVMLDKHGPNIVFNHNIKAEEIIQFINDNFDLTGTTAGFKEVILFDKLGRVGNSIEGKVSTTLEDAKFLLAEK